MSSRSCQQSELIFGTLYVLHVWSVDICNKTKLLLHEWLFYSYSGFRCTIFISRVWCWLGILSWQQTVTKLGSGINKQNWHHYTVYPSLTQEEGLVTSLDVFLHFKWHDGKRITEKTLVRIKKSFLQHNKRLYRIRSHASSHMVDFNYKTWCSVKVWWAVWFNSAMLSLNKTKQSPFSCINLKWPTEVFLTPAGVNTAPQFWRITHIKTNIRLECVSGVLQLERTS